MAMGATAGAVEGGRVDPLDGAVSQGDVSGIELVAPAIAIVAAPDGSGYWILASNGEVFRFGGATFHGSAGALTLNKPMVGMAATPSGNGYWLVASDGGVFSYGDARFFGSTGDLALNKPIVAMASSSSGNGYWLVASDGGVFAFGDAAFHGSTGGLMLNQPIVAMGSTPTGGGYWLLALDGGVFAFGDAPFHGSAPGLGLGGVHTGIVASGSDGYSIVDSSGRSVAFGSASLSQASECDVDPVVSVTSLSSGSALLLRRPLTVPAEPASAASSTRDSTSIDELLDHAQACQESADPSSLVYGAPMAGVRITSTFGSRRHPLWGVVQLHAGVDAISDGGTLGAAVNATAGGTVVGVDSRVAYGTAVIVDHGGRLATVYAHLASVDVAVGDVVNRGDRLGGAGATGFATGAHLHYEIRSNGAPIDPTSYLSGTSSTRSAEVGHVFHWPTSTTTP